MLDCSPANIEGQNCSHNARVKMFKRYDKRTTIVVFITIFNIQIIVIFGLFRECLVTIGKFCLILVYETV